MNKGNVTGTLNDEGVCVDLYLPRKCEYTNKILHSKDRSSVQINVCEVKNSFFLLKTFKTHFFVKITCWINFKVDENGVAIKGKNRACMLAGFVRAKGQSDMALEHTLKQKNLYPYKN